MPTYFPTASDGRVNFYDYGCHQTIEPDGLTIVSGIAERLVDLGVLKVGTPTKTTKQAAVLLVEVAPYTAEDTAPPVPPAPAADTPATPAKADNAPTPPAPDPAQPSGPAATDSPPREK